MKRTLQTLLLALVALPMLAQAVEHDNRLYLTVDEVTENNQVELSLHLANPTIALTAVELYVTLPDGATLSAGSPTARAAQHTLTEGNTENGHFISIASSALATFAGNDGALCTWVCDLSQVTEGEHDILTTGLFAVGVGEGNAITAYTADEQALPITITGTSTSITAPSSSCGTLTIYNMQGQRLSAPQKGQVNIINGKRLLLDDFLNGGENKNIYDNLWGYLWQFMFKKTFTMILVKREYS